MTEALSDKTPRTNSRSMLQRGFGAVLRWAAAGYSYLRFGRQENLRRQIERHVGHWNLDNAIAISHALVPRMVDAGLPRTANILVVGCCNMLEIHTFLSYGYSQVRGIDLISHDRRYIRRMDMHAMSFPDNSFDALYCAGAVQCTHDPEKLRAEFARVLKPGGLVALSVPVGFQLSDIYPYDAVDAETLHKLFRLKPQNIFWSETLPGEAPTNPSASTTVRTLFYLP